MTSFFRVAIARIRVFRYKSALAGELKTNVDLDISKSSSSSCHTKPLNNQISLRITDMSRYARRPWT